MPMKLYVTTDGYFVMCDERCEIVGARPATAAEGSELLAWMTREHEAAKAIGVQAHHISAAGIAVEGSLNLSLTMNDEAKATGDKILAEVSSALNLRNERARARALGRLVDICADVVLRVPEVHDYLDLLYAEGRTSTIRGILGESRRGRPRTNVLSQVAIARHLKSRKLWTKESAAAHAQRFTKSVAAVANDYSKYHKLLELYGSRYVEAARLMHDRWQWPGRRERN